MARHHSRILKHKPAPMKRINRRDATERNVGASIKRDTSILARVRFLEAVVSHVVKALAPGERAIVRRAFVTIRDRQRRQEAKR